MESLTPQEEELMQAVWKLKEGAIQNFREVGAIDLPYTTVASTMRNLEKKGYVKSKMFGNVYVYKPAIVETEYKKKFMQKVVADYFESSYKEMVNFFVHQKKLSTKELKEIINMIESSK